MRLSLVIPCYNEAENLPQLIARCKEVFSAADAEVVLVNNGSTDNSAEIMRDSLRGQTQIRSIEVTENQGYGFGILQGLAAAKGEYIGWTHADLQCDPADALEVLEHLDVRPKETQFFKGRRYGRSTSDIIFTLGMTVFCSVVMGCRLSDINAQPNIFPRSFYEKWRNPPHDFALDMYAYVSAKKRRLKVVRFPVHFGRRVAGEAHLHNLRAKLRYTRKMMRYTLTLRREGSA